LLFKANKKQCDQKNKIYHYNAKHIKEKEVIIFYVEIHGSNEKNNERNIEDNIKFAIDFIKKIMIKKKIKIMEKIKNLLLITI